MKIEDMKVEINYSKEIVDKDRLYDIFTNIIKRLETQDKKEGVEHEKKDSSVN